MAADDVPLELDESPDGLVGERQQILQGVMAKRRAFGRAHAEDAQAVAH